MGGFVCYDEKNAGNTEAALARYEELCAKIKQLYDEHKIEGYSTALFLDESQALDDPAIAIGFSPHPLIDRQYPFSLFNLTGKDEALINEFLDAEHLAVLIMVTDYGWSIIKERYQIHNQFIDDVKENDIPAVRAFLAQNLGISFKDAEGKTAYDYASNDVRELLDEYTRAHPSLQRCERCAKRYLKHAVISGNQCGTCIAESFKSVYDIARELK